MSPDERDEEAAAGGPPASQDRSWRHPSELGDGSAAGPAETAAPAAAAHAQSRPGLVVATTVVGVVLAATGLTLVLTGRNRVPAHHLSATRVSTTDATAAFGHEQARSVQSGGAVQLIVRTTSGRRTAAATIVRSDGYLVTGSSSAPPASEVTVVLPDGRHLSAVVLGRDVPTDTALLRVDAIHLVVTAATPAVGRRSAAVATATSTSTDPGTAGPAPSAAVGRRAQVVADLVDEAEAGTRWEGAHGRSVDPRGTVRRDEDCGVLLTEVPAGSRAFLSGLRQGDVVLRVVGEPVSSMAEMRVVTAHEAPGRPVVVAYQRAGLTSRLTLAP